MNEKKLFFACDYMEGAHPNIINTLVETNFCQTAGYGFDEYSESAKEAIRKACKSPNARVEFLVGGTQTNATVIDALLRSYEGVIAAETGHIAVHEAGAIEFGGHKVLALPATLGKITAQQIDTFVNDYYNDDNHEHMVAPGMVYISHPTEYGTLYSKEELTAISNVCRAHKIPLYVDGARLAYALGCDENEITLPDLTELCDAFYIGGTKCGALFGEAVVLPNPDLIPQFFTIIKQHGALLAKGRILGIQFNELFKDDLYLHIGKDAITYANAIREALSAKGFQLCFDSPTNQVFFVIENDKMEALQEKVEFSFWEKYDDTHSIIRFATCWATKKEDVDALVQLINTMN
ncbi:MAG: low specificity L-threonine aldolase [Veillonella sp.]|uniref:threonine aldolase family protein n=1 Tax=Veillonella sp. TaxID=1926307 RepID=UPI0025F9A697|nr:beta-eliminating lyase-related protein [Veillonella sp.]MBS4912604.1 low specificity L-threonine aldolase [Veillonella sp.]